MRTVNIVDKITPENLLCEILCLTSNISQTIYLPSYDELQLDKFVYNPQIINVSGVVHYITTGDNISLAGRMRDKIRIRPKGAIKLLTTPAEEKTWICYN